MLRVVRFELLWAASSARTVMCAIAVGLMVSPLSARGGSPAIGDPGPAEAQLAQDAMKSVFPQRDWVFANTQGGLYRASRRDKKWQRLPTPRGLPCYGFFAEQPPDSSFVYYNAPAATLFEAFPADGSAFGLYRFDLNGRNWNSSLHNTSSRRCM